MAIATTADGLIDGPTADPASVEAALDRAQPGGGAGSGWPRLSGADVHFVTDGAVARAIDPGVTVHSVYESAPNAGITAFEVRPALDGTSAGEAYLEVGNFGAAQQVQITVTRGGTTLLDRRADMASGEALREVVMLPRGGAQDLRARITASRDALAEDNEAFGWIQDAHPVTVTIVSDQPRWLVPIVGASTNIQASFIAPADYKAGQEDAVIFDRTMPPAAPVKPALYIAPPGGGWLGPSPDRVEQRPQWTASSAHPLLEGVDPRTVSIERARLYQPPQLTPLVRSATGTPLVWIADAAGRPRSTLIAFGPGDSNLASAPAFPILIGNAIDWLARPPVSTAHHTGRAAFDAAITRVTNPRGSEVPLLSLPGHHLAMLRMPGLYGEEAGSTRATFAVNIADPDVSNLTRTTVDAARGALTVGAGLTPRPWWMYLAALAFAIVLIEWWTWLRRITV